MMGASREGNANLDNDLPRWSLVERLCKGGIELRDQFWKMWAKLFGTKFDRCRCLERYGSTHGPGERKAG
jgi:acyl-CoA synthetase (AMP-forming)/AMP-acid ligase II